MLAKTSKPKKSRKSPQAETIVAAPAPAPKKAKTKDVQPSMSSTLRSLVCQEPKMRVDDLVAKLSAAGFPTSRVTASTLRNDCRATLAELNKLGLGSFDL